MYNKCDIIHNKETDSKKILRFKDGSSTEIVEDSIRQILSQIIYLIQKKLESNYYIALSDSSITKNLSE